MSQRTHDANQDARTHDSSAASPLQIRLPILGTGPGSQPEDDTLEYMQLPRGMETYRAPVLPEPEALGDVTAVCALLREVQAALRAVLQGARPESIPLGHLSAADRELLAQVLGEGEVSAVLQRNEHVEPALEVQESRFAGVWRVLALDAAGTANDRLEIGALPAVLIERARHDGQSRGAELDAAPLPDGVMNASAILAELRALWQTSAPEPAHVINFSLLPLSAADVAVLDATLGQGSVTILSRGYGNCRIQNTARPHTWRVVYYNSQDTIILNTLEVTDVPAVACAAPQDFSDSILRLDEVSAFLEGP